ncbi:MAG: aromatic ring-hydroxylating dioxygenase subunit alpha [Acidimicrobiaceae bacterium]|nr:aromatic ring-hydroxylating dioxygenase subunit alpha [Acidimicrobiaceae bacterium]
MTISLERTSGSEIVPFAMTSPMRVPRERYFDRGFFELEKEKLWRRVWQMACRLEEIPEPGDFVEYEICDQSLLVVRQLDYSVKAFENACRHRATQLAVGAGRLPGRQIVCPFHGWRWNLDGTNSFVFHDEQFAPECTQPEDLRLRACKVDTWGGCVWVNLDRDARPLREALSPAAGILDGLGVENMRVKYWKEVILHANWKVAQEAFFEGYHVPQTHPQLWQCGADATMPAVYQVFENGHGQFTGGSEFAEMDKDTFIEMMRLLWEGQDAMTLEREVRLFEGLRNQVSPGESFITAAVQAVYNYAKGAGIPMPPMENAGLWGGGMFVFPNYMMLPMWANSLAYRSRPYRDDPEWCRFEVWSLETYPVDSEPEGRPVVARYDQDDAHGWGLIPRQDFSNIERQQRGLHTLSFGSTRLATEWERLISSMHVELDRYLAR